MFKGIIIERYQDLIGKAQRLIIKNLHKKLTLEEIAKECGMSKFHFSRVFKRCTGKSFKVFLNEMRVKRAKEMLENPDLSITEICYTIGFSDSSYFNRIFRKFVGMSPSKYRKHLKEKVSQRGGIHPGNDRIKGGTGMNILKELWKDESGATAIEYALIAGLMAAALVGVLTLFKEKLSDLFKTISGKLEEAQEELQQTGNTSP